MLTLGAQPPDMPEAAFGHRLEIPDRVIRELQWEHLVALLKDQAELNLDTREYLPTGASRDRPYRYRFR